jgi:hypothetical protein
VQCYAQRYEPLISWSKHSNVLVAHATSMQEEISQPAWRYFKILSIGLKSEIHLTVMSLIHDMHSSHDLQQFHDLLHRARDVFSPAFYEYFINEWCGNGPFARWRLLDRIAGLPTTNNQLEAFHLQFKAFINPERK